MEESGADGVIGAIVPAMEGGPWLEAVARVLGTTRDLGKTKRKTVPERPAGADKTMTQLAFVPHLLQFTSLYSTAALERCGLPRPKTQRRWQLPGKLGG
jgi:hypothetical protein